MDIINVKVNGELVGLSAIKGIKGDKGDTGSKGDKGDSPVKGTDYWTASDKAEIVSSVLSSLDNAEGSSY